MWRRAKRAFLLACERCGWPILGVDCVNPFCVINKREK